MAKKFTDEYFEKYNWNEIQKFYDEGNTWKDVINNYNISNRGLSQAIKKGLFKTRTKSEANKMAHKKRPRKHSEETKKKLSDIRKKFLSENPDKVPYLLNHSSKKSYPEEYFSKLFKIVGIDVVEKHRVWLYELDFSIPQRKIDIEIDGEQHYSDEKIIESDKRRNNYLEKRGWSIIRIRWSEYQRLSENMKNKFIKQLNSYIIGLISVKPYIEIDDRYKCICGGRKSKKSKLCINCWKKNQKSKKEIQRNKKEKKKRKKYICKCGNECTNKNKRCRYCYEIDRRKVKNRPTIEELLKEVEKNGYSSTGRKYNVSDNTIRKWIKQ